MPNMISFMMVFHDRFHESWEKKNKTNKIQKNKVKKGLARWQYCHIYDSWKAETEQKLFNWNKVSENRVKRMKKKIFFEFLLFYFVEKGNSQQYFTNFKPPKYVFEKFHFKMIQLCSKVF